MAITPIAMLAEAAGLAAWALGAITDGRWALPPRFSSLSAQWVKLSLEK